ncbi:MAG TPA: bifunctional allantoicase/(S)-ureidoglycine aminohydrolase [Solirubrobacteraceae bacterium]|nr:bifunctional allantoicase/(S)-ureidoglycine aminohydrolase [Solirubrobacteraceae bacterium]
MTDYYVPRGGLPGQREPATDRAIFTQGYAVLPKGTMRDIVTSRLPFWNDARFWILARPLSGFAETFSHYIAEVSAGGGSDQPEPDALGEAVLFVVDGRLQLVVDGGAHTLDAGGYAYLPAGSDWTLHNGGDRTACFHWIRKRYEPVPGLDRPPAVIGNDRNAEPQAMPDTDGAWATTRFVDPEDVRHDMHVNIVTFQPGATIPFAETHVMEHGLYVLQGKALYVLNRDAVEVEAGDFIWLRAFCPQSCFAAGPEPFRYLLYKDVHRHPSLQRF